MPIFIWRPSSLADPENGAETPNTISRSVIPRVAAMLVAADNDGKSIGAGVEGRVARLRDGDSVGGGAAAGAGAGANAATVVAPAGGGGAPAASGARGGGAAVAARVCAGAAPVAAGGCEVTLRSRSARSRLAAAQSICLLVTVRWPAAERGELSKAEVLEARRPAGRRPAPSSREPASNFADQWLYLRNLESITPDGRLFPDFDDNLRQACVGRPSCSSKA